MLYVVCIVSIGIHTGDAKSQSFVRDSICTIDMADCRGMREAGRKENAMV